MQPQSQIVPFYLPFDNFPEGARGWFSSEVDRQHVAAVSTLVSISSSPLVKSVDKILLEYVWRMHLAWQNLFQLASTTRIFPNHVYCKDLVP